MSKTLQQKLRNIKKTKKHPPSKNNETASTNTVPHQQKRTSRNLKKPSSIKRASSTHQKGIKRKLATHPILTRNNKKKAPLSDFGSLIIFDGQCRLCWAMPIHLTRHNRPTGSEHSAWGAPTCTFLEGLGHFHRMWFEYVSSKQSFASVGCIELKVESV